MGTCFKSIFPLRETVNRAAFLFVFNSPLHYVRQFLGTSCIFPVENTASILKKYNQEMFPYFPVEFNYVQKSKLSIKNSKNSTGVPSNSTRQKRRNFPVSKLFQWNNSGIPAGLTTAGKPVGFSWVFTKTST